MKEGREGRGVRRRLALAGTIQFGSAIQAVREELASSYTSLSVPQSKPLSPGEVLGCTAPVLTDACATATADVIVFVADGRFHLEAIMIANPTIPAYRYDPYKRVLTKEEYDHGGMRAVRRKFGACVCICCVCLPTEALFWWLAGFIRR
jgi:2-(3-amino-3-carboxypropyl)histidine synthase